jgi:biopolymer transport protein ExbD
MRSQTSFRGAMQVRRRRRGLYQAVFEPKPICDVNTTPLIDVMLVLLIMIMITLPAMSHKVPIDLPGEGMPTGTPPKIDQLEIARSGALTWNGRPVPTGALQAQIAAHLADPANPVLQLKSDGETRYERFDETLAIVKAAGVTRLGIVKNADPLGW